MNPKYFMGSYSRDFSISWYGLDLGGKCGIEQIPQFIVLELLNISYNRLTTLTDLRHSTKLRVLYARSNRIANVGAAC